MKRYRSTIMVDIWADTKEEAEKMSMDIVLGLPNSFQDTLSECPHGSEVSLIAEEPKGS